MVRRFYQSPFFWSEEMHKAIRDEMPDIVNKIVTDRFKELEQKIINYLEQYIEGVQYSLSMDVKLQGDIAKTCTDIVADFTVDKLDKMNSKIKFTRID